MDFVSPVLVAGTILMLVFLLWGVYLNRSSRREVQSAAVVGATASAAGADLFNGELPDGGAVRVGPKNPLLKRQQGIGLAECKTVAKVRVPHTARTVSQAASPSEEGSSADEADPHGKSGERHLPEGYGVGKEQAMENISKFRGPTEAERRPPLQSTNRIGFGPGTAAKTSNRSFDTVQFTYLFVLEKDRKLLVEGNDIEVLFRKAGMQWHPHKHSFHRLDMHTGESTYEVISACNPGHFESRDLSGFLTVGLVMFLELGRVANPSNAFDMMYRFALTASEVLPNVEVCDNQQVPLCEQRLQKYRQAVAEYSRERLSVAVQ